jgi:hypothetical protein
VNTVVEPLPENLSASLGEAIVLVGSYMEDVVPKYAMIVFIRLGQQVLEYYLQQAILDILYIQGYLDEMECKCKYHLLLKEPK